ncbi:adenine phosphoribosyltransferase [Rathayibacter sp. ZW T2_19]|uniref:Adenine phosphoribosyltransferase n=1 Tax=Rathayibacter rubneri TaxID=2950106 RepID=A0A9X2IUY4_9MICO|nr:phosphoribosyltransferase family protein [Rathayibacter rubneri]MCM6763094.1 adenine phosphoribosyltransferase [Rathayibacter rubneri]
MTDPHDLRGRLVRAHGDSRDRASASASSDVTGWWRDPALLAALGPGLGDLFAEEEVTAVLGPQTRGTPLAALTALHRGVGLVEARKASAPVEDSADWWESAIALDYRDDPLLFRVRRALLGPGDRVLLVDDWIETGTQAAACRRLVELAGAEWVGAAVVVDGLEDDARRADLRVRSLVLDAEL